MQAIKNCEENPQKLHDISTLPKKIRVGYVPSIQDDGKYN